MHTDLLNMPAERQIISERVIKAPQDAVYNAWADPGLLAKWWGPAGFTNTFHEFDLRSGGHWRFTMHGPEKGNYENHCVFLEIAPPSLIAWNRLSKPIFRVVTTFDATAEGHTLLTFRMQFDTAEEANKLRPYVVDKNEENFDKLEALLGDGAA